MQNINEFFTRKATDIYAYVAMVRVLPYAIVVTILGLWQTLGWWFAFDAAFLIAVAAIASGIKPGLLGTALTLGLSLVVSTLSYFSAVGVNDESAALVVFAFMFADGILAIAVSMFGPRAMEKAAK